MLTDSVIIILEEKKKPNASQPTMALQSDKPVTGGKHHKLKNIFRTPSN